MGDAGCLTRLTVFDWQVLHMNFSLINPISIKSAVQLFMNTDEKQNGLHLNISSSSLCKGKIGFFLSCS